MIYCLESDIGQVCGRGLPQRHCMLYSYPSCDAGKIDGTGHLLQCMSGWRDASSSLVKTSHQNNPFPVSYSFTLPMLRLLSSKPEERKDFWKPSKPSCHVVIHWIALAECSQMSTHLQGCQSFLVFLHHFVLAELVAISMRVKAYWLHCIIMATFRECAMKIK